MKSESVKPLIQDDVKLLKIILNDKENLVENLLKEYLTIPTLIAEAESDDLCYIKGMTPEKRLLLTSLKKFSEKIYSKHGYEKNILNSSQKADRYIRPFIAHKENEVFMVIFLNSQNDIIDHKILFEGTINEAVIYPRVVVKAALRRNAQSIILAHNHPGGSIKPSQGDIKVTQRIKEALNLVDMALLDHFILTKNSYFSFAEERLVI